MKVVEVASQNDRRCRERRGHRIDALASIL